MPLYEVAILERPTKDGEKKGELERFVLEEKVVAADEQSAVTKVLLESAGELDGRDTNRLQVLVRPFVE